MANEPELLPAFQAGEPLTIQRNVDGKNVLMVVTVEDPCSLGTRAMKLKARINVWGESSYADGRVSRQLESIDRLLAERQTLLDRLKEAAELLGQSCWHQSPGEVEDRARRWLSQEGTTTAGEPVANS